MKEDGLEGVRGGPVGVFLVGDVALHREGLARLLATDAGVAVLGGAPFGPGAIARIGELLPELVLLDVRSPARFAEARAIREAVPQTRIVAIAVPESEQEIVRWAEAGISGYVAPEASAVQLAATLASVARGELPCSPRIAAALMRRVASLASGPALTSRLTRRELQVVDLVAEGLSNEQIARVLMIEVTTVKTHVHRILEKLDFKRRGELGAYVRTGIVEQRARKHPPIGM